MCLRSGASGMSARWGEREKDQTGPFPIRAECGGGREAGLQHRAEGGGTRGAGTEMGPTLMLEASLPKPISTQPTPDS